MTLDERMKTILLITICVFLLIKGEIKDSNMRELGVRNGTLVNTVNDYQKFLGDVNIYDDIFVGITPEYRYDIEDEDTPQLFWVTKLHQRVHGYGSPESNRGKTGWIVTYRIEGEQPLKDCKITFTAFNGWKIGNISVMEQLVTVNREENSELRWQTHSLDICIDGSNADQTKTILSFEDWEDKPDAKPGDVILNNDPPSKINCIDVDIFLIKK